MRTVALALAVIITAISCVDWLYCSDGCTRDDLGVTHHARTGGDCPICQPGAVAMASSGLAAGLAVVSVSFSADQPVLKSFSQAIEHPPRPTA